MNLPPETKTKLYLVAGGVAILIGCVTFLRFKLSNEEFVSALFLITLGGFKLMEFLKNEKVKQEQQTQEQLVKMQSEFLEALKPILKPITKQLKLYLPVGSSFDTYRECETFFFFKLKLKRIHLPLINEEELLPIDEILQEFINENLRSENENRFEFMKRFYTTEELRALVDRNKPPIRVRKIYQEASGFCIDFEIHKRNSNYFHQESKKKNSPPKKYPYNHNIPEIKGTKIPLAVKEAYLNAGIPAYKSMLYWDYEKYPHLLLTGTTGSGKSSFLYEILHNLVFVNESTLLVSDFKGDDALEFLEEYPHFYKYKDAFKGLELLHNYLKERQAGNKDRSPVFLVFDEFAAFIASQNDKKTSDKYKEMLSEIAMMGRSFKLHLILSMQRPDSSYFGAGGARDNLINSFVVTLGSQTKESVKMLFDGFSSEIEQDREAGSGYALVGGSKLHAIKSVWITSQNYYQSEILNKLL